MYEMTLTFHKFLKLYYLFQFQYISLESGILYTIVLTPNCQKNSKIW